MITLWRYRALWAWWAWWLMVAWVLWRSDR